MTSRQTSTSLIETRHLRVRYYSAARVRADTSALSIPVTLILRWDGYSTRPVRVKAQDRRLYVLCLGTGVKHRQLPNSGLLLRLTKQNDLITKLGPTRDSNLGPLDVQPYMLATTTPRQSIL
ncbi:unnamed protein product, partial [Brenthis ino]